MARECSLCGGKLKGNICTECGLDNSKCDANYRTISSHKWNTELTHVHEKEEPLAGKTLTRANLALERKKNNKGNSVVAVLIFFFILAMVFVAIFEDSGWDDSEGYDEYPYEWVTYDLEDTGEVYETTLTAGTYIAGVHIPEGTYEVTLVNGEGSLVMECDDQEIYIETYVYEEDAGEVIEPDFRVYEGACIEIEEDAEFHFYTENAVLPMEDTFAE